MIRDQGITREQKRARGAAAQVELAMEKLGSPGKAGKTTQLTRYNGYAHALPVWIRTNGLLQAVAFLESKVKGQNNAAALLVADLGAHLREASFPPYTGTLSRALCDLPYEDYARWQEEAVKCAGWIKRFAAARIGVVDSNASEAGDEGDD